MKYKSLMEFAIFGKDDEEINVNTLVVTKKKSKVKLKAAKEGKG